MLSNLIDNGVKYGHRVVVIPNDSRSQLQLSINDEGNGIPKERFNDVFEPYFRLAKDKDGHGLGLGISRNILHAHGGDLILENLSEGGFSVQLLIPRNLSL